MPGVAPGSWRLPICLALVSWCLGATGAQDRKLAR